MGVCELTGMLIVECRNYTDAVDMKAKPALMWIIYAEATVCDLSLSYSSQLHLG